MATSRPARRRGSRSPRPPARPASSRARPGRSRTRTGGWAGRSGAPTRRPSASSWRSASPDTFIRSRPMAIYAATNYYISINGVDLSGWCKTVELTHKAGVLDSTTFGTNGTKTNVAGLKEWSLTIAGNQDYASGGPDATLNALVGGAAVTVIVRSTTSADSATNPSYTGSAICTDYNPMAGSIGELAQFSATFQSAGALSRDVTP